MSEPAVSRGAEVRAPAAGGAPDPHLKRNLVLLTLDGAFFSAGSAFYDSGTVLSVFVSTLTGSRFLIGLAATARTIGWFLPQLFVASLTEHLPYKGKLVIVNSLLHRLLLLFMAAVTYLCAGTRPGLALAVFLPIFLVSAMSEGVNGVPWTDVVANAIPADRRGRLFANQQIIGGLAAFANGFAVRLILQRAGYPQAYVILFLCTFVWFMGSIVSFMGVKEKPAVQVRQERRPLGSYLRALPAIWRGNPRFARVMVVRFCLGFIYLSMPFFVLHARQNLGVDLGTVGIFVSAQMLGVLVGSAVAGPLSDRTGNRTVVVVAIVSAFAAPASALVLTLAKALGAAGAAGAFPLVYFFAGAAFGAGYIGFTNYVIDVAPPVERPTYIGLSNTLMAPFGFLSAVGGAVAAALGYEAVFAASAVVGFAGLIMSLRLSEPRREPGRRSPRQRRPPKTPRNNSWPSFLGRRARRTCGGGGMA